MPSHLRPTAPVAADAILAGDPGRALLLAQELLSEPKMSNHARGLWGYSGATPAGRPLTIQSTGIGGPSAALVLGDLAELGVRRVVRVGTAAGFAPGCRLGELLAVGAALAEGGSAQPYGASPGETVPPDPALTARLEEELSAEGRGEKVASFDAHPATQSPLPGTAAADMQTAPLLAQARSLSIAAAAVLIVAELAGAEARLEKEQLEEAEKQAGRIASRVLSG
jgi:uridine phosphorylase